MISIDLKGAAEFATVVIAAMTVLTAIVVPALQFINRQLLHQINAAVNGRLDKALAKISDLERVLAAKRIAELETQLADIAAVEDGPEAKWPST